MAKRKPSLSAKSFLGHIFSPKKNPQPSGLRKTTLSGVRGGRSKARLAAFNRMSPVSQEMLTRAGMREQYLRGEAKLSDAKKALRPEGVRLGVAKPVRSTGPVIRTSLDARVAAHLKYVTRESGKTNPHTIDKNISLIPDGILPDVEHWDYSRVKAAGGKDSPYTEVIDGHRRNPFWYH